MDEASARQMLLPRMAERRSEIRRWLRTSRVKSNRLAIIAVVAGALGALATAGPATGGTSFTNSVGAGLNLSDYSAVWQVLCVVGMLTSIVSAVIAGLQRHFDLASRVGAAENAAVELENVSALLEMGQIPVADAMSRYQQAVATVPFIDDGGDARPAMPGYPAPAGPGPGYGPGPVGPPPGPPGPMNQQSFPGPGPGPVPGQVPGPGHRPGPGQGPAQGANSAPGPEPRPEPRPGQGPEASVPPMSPVQEPPQAPR